MIWRLAFAEGMLAPGAEWKHFEEAFLQSASVAWERRVLQTQGWVCDGVVHCFCVAIGDQSLGLVTITLGNKPVSAHFMQEGGPGGFSVRAAAAAKAHPRCF